MTNVVWFKIKFEKLPDRKKTAALYFSRRFLLDKESKTRTQYSYQTEIGGTMNLSQVGLVSRPPIG